MSKIEELHKLVIKRRLPSSGTISDGYTINYRKIGDFHGGLYDFDNHVVPYSKIAFNLDADIMIFGQDWASEEFLSKPFNKAQAEFGYTPELATNIRLFSLLKKFFNLEFRQVYASDVFVFVKPGQMAGQIPFKDIKKSALEYAIPQIHIIKPKIVICLGASTFNSVRAAHGIKETKLTNGLIPNNFIINDSIIVGVHHVGGLGTAAAGGIKAQEAQWSELSSFFKNL